MQDKEKMLELLDKAIAGNIPRRGEAYRGL